MTDDSPQGALRLQDWGVIRARGPEAAAFLHGQLTQDITGLAAGQARLAGYCNAKGRLLATLVVWRHGADELLLACSADLLPATLKRLSMFVLRAKCKLSDASAELLLHGLAGSAAAHWLDTAPDAPAWQVLERGVAQAVRLPDAENVPRWLYVASADAPVPALPALAPAAWSRLEVASAVPRVVAATAEQFVPQMINLEAVGGVNFQKGCYPGQEIVARSQYRGTLKRRALLYASAAHAQPGQEVFAADDPSQPAGMVVNAAVDAGGGLALVEVKLSAADTPLHLGAPDGPALQPRPLPYALPAQS